MFCATLNNYYSSSIRVIMHDHSIIIMAYYSMLHVSMTCYYYEEFLIVQ